MPQSVTGGAIRSGFKLAGFATAEAKVVAVDSGFELPLDSKYKEVLSSNTT